MTFAPPPVRSRALAQVAEYSPAAEFGPRPLRDYEFVWVLRGSARWLVTTGDPVEGAAGLHKIDLRPGILALARRGTTDHYRWDPDRASAHAYVHFEVDDTYGIPGEDAREWPLTRPMAGHDPLRALCDYLLDLASLGGTAAHRRSDQVIAMMLDVYLSGPFPQVTAELRIPAPLRPAIELAHETWSADGVRLIPVAELAAGAGMSQGHFSRAFSAAFGCGPATALEAVRLARAAIALQRSNLGLAEIAHACGFADPYHFSRRFATAYHVPPGRFRHADGAGTDPLGPVAARGLLALWAVLGTDTSR